MPSEVDYSKLFNCNKNRDGDNDGLGLNKDTEPDIINSKNMIGGGEPMEKISI
jgi:hypothetical protein